MFKRASFPIGAADVFRGSALRRLTRETAVVTTSDGHTFRGVVIGVYDDALALAHARALLGEAEQELSGEILIPLAKVAFIVRALP